MAAICMAAAQDTPRIPAMGTGERVRVAAAAEWVETLDQFGEALPGLSIACGALQTVLKGIADWKHNKNAAFGLSMRLVQ